MRPGSAREPDCAEKLQREPIRPVCLRQLKKIAPARGPGIVHDNVNRAISLERGVQESRRSLRSAEIACKGYRRSATSFDFSDDLGERGRIAGGQDEFSAFLCQAQSNGAPDPTAAAGHNRDLSFKRSGVRHGVRSLGFRAQSIAQTGCIGQAVYPHLTACPTKDKLALYKA